jgi:hypothetical protein
LADILYGQRVHAAIGAIFTGPNWAGLLGLSDPTIKQVLGKSVPGFSRFRPDLVDLRTGEVYEIKPIGSETLGYQQLAGYLIILNTSDPSHRAWVPGETFQPPVLPEMIELDPKTVALIEPPILGLIVYEVINSNELIADGGFSLAAAVRLSETAEEAEEAELGTEVGGAGLAAEAGVP